MANPSNVQIPYEAFKQMIAVCEDMKYLIDIHELNFGYYSDLEDILAVLKDKERKLEIRRAYGKLIAANKGEDEDVKDETRIEYLKKKGPRPDKQRQV